MKLNIGKQTNSLFIYVERGRITVGINETRLIELTKVVFTQCFITYTQVRLTTILNKSQLDGANCHWFSSVCVMAIFYNLSQKLIEANIIHLVILST